MNNIAFLIACEEYDQESIPNLDGVNADVEAMSCALIKNCNCSSERVFLITNQPSSECSPSGSSILSFLIQTAEKFRDEQIENLFFYFSGHGYLSHDNVVCLMPKDALLFPIQHGILTQEDIIFVLNQFNHVKHIILFLDICQDELVRKGTMDEGMVDTNYFPKGSVIFYSCFPQKASYMIPPIGIEKYGTGSVFTKCLIESLQPQSGCRTINDISEFLKERVSAVSRELGFEQKPFTQLKDISLSDVVITNHYSDNSSDLSDAEKKIVNDFAHKLDVSDRCECSRFGIKAEEQLINICASIAEFTPSKKMDSVEFMPSNRKTDLNALERDLESFLSILSAYKSGVREPRPLIPKRLIKNLPRIINYDELLSARSKFTENINHHIAMMMMDISMLERAQELFYKNIKEIRLYIHTAELAIKLNPDKETNTLSSRVSDLYSTIQRCNHFLSDSNSYEDFWADMVMQLQVIMQICSLTFGRIVTVGPDEADALSSIDDAIDSLTVFLNKVKHRA